MDTELAVRVVKESLNHYENLPKKGKPIPNKEWTLLSSIVTTFEGKFTVVAMATGTKCLGRNEMSSEGFLVNDSHAEVLARRCFLRYIYDQIFKFKQTGSSDLIIGCNEMNQYEINPKVNFHFYSSHVPCGDASIIPKYVNGVKRKYEIASDETTKQKKIAGVSSSDELKIDSKTDLKITRESGIEYSRDNHEARFNTDNGSIWKGSSILESMKNSTRENSRKIAQDLILVNENLNISDQKDELSLNAPPKFRVTASDGIRNHKNSTENCIEENINTSVTNMDKFGKNRDNKNCTREYIQQAEEISSTNKPSKPSLYTNNEELRNIVGDYPNIEDLKSSLSRNSTGGLSNEDLQCSVGNLVDVYRTGAKCVTGEDGKLPGALYHVLGAVRTKPGRGDPTLSVSCSDKLARWIACGLQGALLSLLLSRPVMLDSVVIGSGGPYCAEALQRALILRTGTSHRPSLLQSSVVFPHSRYTAPPTAKPCPSAILWSRVAHKPLEVCVDGRRQGTTKKCHDNGRLMVCKLELLKTFLSLSGDRFQGMTYRNIKQSADHYNSIWAQARGALGTWTSKPTHLEDFTLS